MKDEGLSKIASVATLAKLTPETFETNGRLLEVRRLHSMTKGVFLIARNWMLKGPVILRADDNCWAIFLIFSKVSEFTFWVGKTIVESPLCIPAFSMCSVIANVKILPFFETASISISLAS